MSTKNFACGHPTTEDNSVSNGTRLRPRCAICKRAYERERSQRRRDTSPSVAPPPGDWVTRGACRDNRARLAPLFDPFEHGEAGTPEAAKKFAAAVALCGSCPVAATCRSYAETHRLVGTWGGTYFGPGDHQTPQERAA